jgi:hypothetical protein
VPLAEKRTTHHSGNLGIGRCDGTIDEGGLAEKASLRGQRRKEGKLSQRFGARVAGARARQRRNEMGRTGPPEGARA